MDIDRIKTGNWDKVRAYFDLATEEGIKIKGFKIIDGSNGLFVGFPSKKGNDGEYHDTVHADAEIRKEISELALAAYHRETGEKPFEESTESEPPPFGDDGIPF